MLSTYFKNYDEFSVLFEKKENGQRRNKVFLGAYKYACKNKRRSEFEALFSVSDENLLYGLMSAMYRNCGKSFNKIVFSEFVFYSKKYIFDEKQGICDDGDVSCVRYVNVENGRVFKMKAGKFARAILQEHDFVTVYGEVACNYFCERFSEVFKKTNEMHRYTLQVDNDFKKIYNSDFCADGDFGSCMTNTGQYSFYKNAVDASAAALLDNDGKIAARCIIFNEVLGYEDKILRYADRQYCAGWDDVLKRILIDKLISGGHIDCYKKIGSGSGDAREVVLNDGTSLSNVTLRINCRLESGDILSYQDTFKYYSYNSEIATNNIGFRYSHMLDVTDKYFDSIECECCGCSLFEDDCYNTDNGTFCENCYCDRYTRCDDCGKDIDIYNSETHYTLRNGDRYCEFCCTRH